MQRGIVTLVFDDGYSHILENIVPILDHYHIPGVFAVPFEKSTIEQETRFPITSTTTWQQNLRNTSHELAAHSITHRNLTTLPPSELDQELSQPAQTLQTTTLIYPGGAHNDTVITATQKHYQAARTVMKGFNALPPADPMRLKTYNFTHNNFSPLKANLLATWAYLTNSWLIETYHLITDQPTTLTHTVSPQAFEKHLKFLAKMPIKTQTIKQVIEDNK